MKPLTLIFVGLVTAPLVGAADWIKVTSANFELYTTSGEREARQTLEVFEQVRDFFMRVKSSSVTTRLPVTIVGFRNPKEYKPYTVSEAAAAYYTGDEQHDYIVMSDLASEHTPMAIHEYMHLLVRHSGLKMPLWLNEGFADVYSTLKPKGGQIVLGEVPPGRAYVLNQQKWMPLPALFAVQHDSPEYNEKNRAGIFYAQSWLLAHMLVLSPQYRDKFPEFVAQLSGSGSAEGSFSTVYGKSAAEVNKDMSAYSRQSSLTGVAFKEGFRKIEIASAQPADEVPIAIILARLVAFLGRRQEAAARLQELAAAHKDSFEVEEALAYTEWSQGNRDLAIRHFEQAVARGDTSWKTNWDYARLLGGATNSREKTIRALRIAIQSKPDLVDARLMLGHELYQERSYAQALIELRQVKSIDAEHAHALFLTMAYCAMEAKVPEEAVKYAEEAKKYARGPVEIDRAQKFLQFLQQKDAPAAPPRLPSGIGDDAQPVLEHREAGNPAAEQPRGPAALTITGRLTQLDCLDGPARMNISSGATMYKLLIREPNKIVINGGAAAVEMRCGPQSKPVSVQYRAGEDREFGTSGEVVEIDFTQ